MSRRDLLSVSLPGAVLVLVADVVFAAGVVVLLTPWLSPVLSSVGLGDWVLLVLWPAIVLIVSWLQIQYVRAEVLSRVDAVEGTPESHPELFERLAYQAWRTGISVPSVAVSPSRIPNSFTVAGVGSRTIVLSEGLLDALDAAELDGVLAHELAHIGSGDTLAATLGSFFPAITGDGLSIWETFLDTRRRLLVAGALLIGGYVLALPRLGSDPGNPEGIVTYLLAVVAIVVVSTVIGGTVATPIARRRRRVAHRRELAADRLAARSLDDPVDLARALQTLDAVRTDAVRTDTVRTEAVKTSTDSSAVRTRGQGQPTSPVKRDEPSPRYDALSPHCLLPGGFPDVDGATRPAPPYPPSTPNGSVGNVQATPDHRLSVGVSSRPDERSGTDGSRSFYDTASQSVSTTHTSVEKRIARLEAIADEDAGARIPAGDAAVT